SRRSWPIYGDWSAAPRGGHSFWTIWPPASSNAWWKPATTSCPKAKSSAIVAIFLYPRVFAAYVPNGCVGWLGDDVGRTKKGVGGGARRDRRDLLRIDVRRDRVRLEGGQRTDDHVDLPLLDELTGLGECARGRAAAVERGELHRPAAERLLLLVEEQRDAVLHLLAGRGQWPGEDREEPETDRLLGNRREGDEHQHDDGQAHNHGALLVRGWVERP